MFHVSASSSQVASLYEVRKRSGVRPVPFDQAQRKGQRAVFRSRKRQTSAYPQPTCPAAVQQHYADGQGSAHLLRLRELSVRLLREADVAVDLRSVQEMQVVHHHHQVAAHHLRIHRLFGKEANAIASVSLIFAGEIGG